MATGCRRTRELRSMWPRRQWPCTVSATCSGGSEMDPAEQRGDHGCRRRLRGRLRSISSGRPTSISSGPGGGVVYSARMGAATAVRGTSHLRSGCSTGYGCKSGKTTYHCLDMTDGEQMEVTQGGYRSQAGGQEAATQPAYQVTVDLFSVAAG